MNSETNLNKTSDDVGEKEGLTARATSPGSAKSGRSGMSVRINPMLPVVLLNRDLCTEALPVKMPKRKAEVSPTDVSGSKSEKAAVVRRPKKKKSNTVQLRNRKVNRRSDDESNLESDVEEVSLISSEVESSITAENRKSKRVVGNLPSPEVITDVLDKCPDLEGYNLMEVSSLGDLGLELIKEAENTRVASKNIKGGHSERFKLCFRNIQAILDSLVDRFGDRGDATRLRAENIELEFKLREKTKTEESLKKEIEIMKMEIRSIQESTKNIRDTYLKSMEDPSARAGQSCASESVPWTAPLPQRVPTSKRNPTMASGGSLDGASSETLMTKLPEKEKRKELEVEKIMNARVDGETSLDETIYKLVKMRNYRYNYLEPLYNPVKPNLQVAPPPPPKKKRGRPKVIRDIQLENPINIVVSSGQEEVSTPGTTTDKNPQEWRTIRRRTRRNVGDRMNNTVGEREEGIGQSYANVVARGAPPRRGTGPPAPRRRPLKTAAVTITGIEDGVSYADALKEAKKRIPLGELDITGSRTRRTVNGGRIIEIPGVDAQKKADHLAQTLREVLGSEFAVNTPTIKGELRLLGLDDSVTQEEVVEVIAQVGGCSMFEIKTGAIRPLRNGLGSIWLQCPLSAAIKTATSGKIKVGWTMAKVILLEKRQVQCFRCWQFGHVKTNCASGTDLSGLCFRCGETGHLARHCFATQKCIACERSGGDASHRFGSINFKDKSNADRRVPVDNTRNGTEMSTN